MFVFAFFLVFSCAYASQTVRACMGGAWAPRKPSQFPFMFCGGLVTTTPSFWPFPPTHTYLSTIVSCATTNQPFCLVLCLLCVHTSPCAHPSPFPPSRVPHYPFMSVCACVCFPGKFPGHTCTPNTPCQPIFVFACFVFVSPRTPTPHHTHISPFAPICTHAHLSATYILLCVHAILVRVCACVNMCVSVTVSARVSVCTHVCVYCAMCGYYWVRLGCIVVSFTCMGQG